MNVLRNATVLAIAFAALAAAVFLMATSARAQSDPFGALYAPPPPMPGAPATPAPSSRTGVTSVNGAVGKSYAASTEGGYASLAQISMLPRTLPPMPLDLKIQNPKVAGGRPRIIVPTYALALVRAGSISAFAGGAGSEMAGRRTSIKTALVGAPDQLAADLAEEAWQDLVKKLIAAGFDVVPQAEVETSVELGRLAVVGVQAKGVNGWSVYGPRSAPLRAGHPYSAAVLAGSKSAIVFSDISAELDALILTPRIAIDYQWLETTGRRNYVGSAQVDAKVWFSILGNSGASYLYGTRKGLGSGPWGGVTLPNNHGSSEPFGIMYEIDDRSDSVSIASAFAQAGLGSMYRQSMVYAVEVEPRRYAALIRAGFQGLNTAIVAELRTARGMA